MAKAKQEEKNDDPTSWTTEELVELVREGEKVQTELGTDVASLTGKVEALTKAVTELQGELARIAPTRSGIPNEIVSGMTMTKLHEQALMAVIVGKMLTTAPAALQNGNLRDKTIDDVLSFADLIFQKAKERYGKA